MGFRFKRIAKDLGEIKGAAFQLPPILSVVTKVPHRHPRWERMEEEGHQTLSRDDMQK